MQQDLANPPEKRRNYKHAIGGDPDDSQRGSKVAVPRCPAKYLSCRTYGVLATGYLRHSQDTVIEVLERLTDSRNRPQMILSFIALEQHKNVWYWLNDESSSHATM